MLINKYSDVYAGKKRLETAQIDYLELEFFSECACVIAETCKHKNIFSFDFCDKTYIKCFDCHSCIRVAKRNSGLNVDRSLLFKDHKAERLTITFVDEVFNELRREEEERR